MSDKPRDPRKVWTTLISNRGYFPGLLVLHHSLIRSGSKYDLLVMVTSEVGSDEEYMRAFQVAGIRTVVVDPIQPDALDPDRVEKYNFFQKFAPWRFEEFDRVCLLDSDQIVLQNIDELMEMDLPEDHILCAHACTCNPAKRPHYPKSWVPENCAWTYAPTSTGVIPQDLFLRGLAGKTPSNAHLLNSGTVVLRPSRPAYENLLKLMNHEPSVPQMVFPDQDLLAIAYRDRWRPLPWWYNALKPMRACHGDGSTSASSGNGKGGLEAAAAAEKKNGKFWDDGKVKILHYILRKPWKGRKGWDKEDPVEQTHELWWKEWEMVEKRWNENEGGVRSEEKDRVWENVIAANLPTEE